MSTAACRSSSQLVRNLTVDGANGTNGAHVPDHAMEEPKVKQELWKEENQMEGNVAQEKNLPQGHVTYKIVHHQVSISLL